MKPFQFLVSGVVVLLLVTAITPAQIATGPAVGDKIPELAMRDQHGNPRTLSELAGPNGLLLLFHRSADW